ncbi:MAG TPA: murein biosynthesis integral membrane protein MurJ, partial [Candidatus Hydrogenedentes bacterium]|nr:murein biosynthesis integral membrane protein MurJ [Candidatus Hydrogenedentota bacterium]
MKQPVGSVSLSDAEKNNSSECGREGARELSRFAAIFAGGTMISRALGLVRDMVFAHVIPGAALGSFLFAFSLPNMLRDMLGEGAVNAALVPVFTAARESGDHKEYRRAVASVMSMMLLIFFALTVIGVLLMPLTPAVLSALRPFTGRELPQSEAELTETVRLMQWTFPYLFFIGAAVFAMAPLFVARRYGTPSWTPVLLNVSFIVCALCLRGYFANPAWALVVGVWLGGLAQMAALWFDMFRSVGVAWPRFHFRHAAVAQTVWLLLPVVFGQAAGEVNKLVDRFFAMSLGEDTVLALYISNRLVQLPLAIFGVAVAVAILPALSQSHAQRDAEKQRSLMLFGLRQSFFLSLPAMVALIVLREPVIRLIFERGEFDAAATERAAGALFYAGMGLVSFAWVKVLVQGFYARHDTRTPVVVAASCMLLNIALNLALVRPMGYQGLALSTSISFTVNFVALYLLHTRR